MKKILLILMMVLLLVGCGTAENKNTEMNHDTTNTESVEVSTDNKDSEVSDSKSENTETQNSETPNTEVPDSETAESETVEKKEYTYKDMDKKMYAKSSVNVRDLPNKDGKKLGGLSTAEEVHVTGQCNETSWYRIEYKGAIAYVSNSYLVDTKPEDPKPDKPQPEDPVEPSEPDNPDPDEPYKPKEDEYVTYGKWRFNRREMGGWESDIKRLAEAGYGVIIDCTNFQGCAILVSSYDDATYEANKKILEEHVATLGYEVGHSSFRVLPGCLDEGVYVVICDEYQIPYERPDDWN